MTGLKGLAEPDDSLSGALLPLLCAAHAFIGRCTQQAIHHCARSNIVTCQMQDLVDLYEIALMVIRYRLIPRGCENFIIMPTEA